MHRYAGPWEHYSWLLNQDEFMIDLHEQDSHGYTVFMSQLVKRSIFCGPRSPWKEFTWTHTWQIEPIDALNVNHSGMTTLHAAVLAYVILWANNDHPEQLRSVIVRLIQLGADVHTESASSVTPLDFMVQRLPLTIILSPPQCAWCTAKRVWRERPWMQWLDMLSEAEIDLRRYGRIEESKQRARDSYQCVKTYNGLIRSRALSRKLHFRYDAGPLGLDIECEDYWAEDMPGGRCFCIDERGHRRPVEELYKLDEALRTKSLWELKKAEEATGSWTSIVKEKPMKIPGGWDT